MMSPMNSATAEMVKVTKVTVTRHEGSPEECVSVEVESLERAGDVLHRMAWTAPYGGGCHKASFRVEWADGESYEGRVELTRGLRTDVSGHMKDRLAFYVRCPRHMTTERWEDYMLHVVKPSARAAAEALLTSNREGIVGWGVR